MMTLRLLSVHRPRKQWRKSVSSILTPSGASSKGYLLLHSVHTQFNLIAVIVLSCWSLQVLYLSITPQCGHLFVFVTPLELIRSIQVTRAAVRKAKSKLWFRLTLQILIESLSTVRPNNNRQIHTLTHIIRITIPFTHIVVIKSQIYSRKYFVCFWCTYVITRVVICNALVRIITVM